MKRAVVIGLGIFGFNVVRELFEGGIEVIAIDRDKEVVQRIREFCTKAIVADGTDKETMESIGIHRDDVVIISFGEDLAGSSLVTLHLKEMNVEHIIVKAPNEDHKHVLEKVGATDVIIPEKQMAVKVARSIISPNILDYIPVSGEYTICELASPPSFYGKTIGELHLRAKYPYQALISHSVLAVTVKHD